MTELSPAAAVSRSDLFTAMVERNQLSPMDAEALEELRAAGEVRAETEEEVLRWLAGEYGLAFTSLEGIEPDRALLSRFPARILLKEEMLPLREHDGTV